MFILFVARIANPRYPLWDISAPSGLILVNGAPLGSNSFVNGKLIYSGGTDQVIIVDVTKSKKKVIDGLDSNVLYNAYMYAFNATGVSPLSFPQVVKCM